MKTKDFMSFQNALTRNLARLSFVPATLRPSIISRLLGKFVPYVGTSGLLYESLKFEEVVVSIRNRRPVQNHIGGVHAAAVALLAETASGFVVGMNLPDDRLPLIKSLQVDYIRRSQGGLRAVARLNADQIHRLRNEDRGEVEVLTTVTDENGDQPVQCRMLWAWVPKKRDQR